ncbi:hypothetical protein DFJ77DRAFT_48701 [Powellomyces hirtus]|nr:hypothetical protein DFJ77DRAFT_48701 [Powellomyces hirtus]
MQQELDDLRKADAQHREQIRNLEIENSELMQAQRVASVSASDAQAQANGLTERITFLEEEADAKGQLEIELQRVRDELRDTKLELSLVKGRVVNRSANGGTPGSSNVTYNALIGDESGIAPSSERGLDAQTPGVNLQNIEALVNRAKGLEDRIAAARKQYSSSRPRPPKPHATSVTPTNGDPAGNSNGLLSADPDQSIYVDARDESTPSETGTTIISDFPEEHFTSGVGSDPDHGNHFNGQQRSAPALPHIMVEKIIIQGKDLDSEIGVDSLSSPIPTVTLSSEPDEDDPFINIIDPVATASETTQRTAPLSPGHDDVAPSVDSLTPEAAVTDLEHEADKDLSIGDVDAAQDRAALGVDDNANEPSTGKPTITGHDVLETKNSPSRDILVCDVNEAENAPADYEADQKLLSPTMAANPLERELVADHLSLEEVDGAQDRAALA